jgi:hypothetical protein
MAAGRPLRYVSGERPLIYSVGENARDDQGKERLPTQSFCEARLMTDMVFHLKQHPRPRRKSRR